MATRAPYGWHTAPVPRTLLALAAALPLLAVLPAVPAHAAAPEPEVWVVSDSDGDGLDGLFRRPLSGGTPTQVVAETDSSDVYALSRSADGSRVVYVVVTRSAAGALSQSIAVRDVSGQLVQTLATRAYDGRFYVGNPHLAPDGRLLVWDLADDDTGGLTTYATTVGSTAAPRVVASGYTPYAFLDQDTLLVQTTLGDPYTVEFTGGPLKKVTGLPLEALNVVVSPDLTKVAYGKYDASAGEGLPVKSPVVVADLAFDGTTASVSNEVVRSSGGYSSQVDFTLDGQSLLFTRNDGDFSGANGASPGNVWSVPLGPGDAVETLTVPAEDDVITVQKDDGTAPGAPTPTPFTLLGTGAAVQWSPPTDSDLSGVVVRRTRVGTSEVKQVFVPAPQNVLSDTGLVLGATYSYALTALDRSGNRSETTTRSLVATDAAPSLPDPTSSQRTTAPFTARWSAAASTTATYTVDYSVNGGGWRSWITSRPVVARTFGSSAGTGIAATTSTPGQTYRLRVTGTDAYGNTTRTVVSGTAVVPLDQTRATLSGGTTVARSDAWLGSLRQLSSPSHFARLAVTGSRLQLVVERCTTCGVMDVFDGGTRIGSVDTRLGRRAPRSVVFTRVWGSVSTHTITVRPRTTAPVLLDGFAVRR